MAKKSILKYFDNSNRPKSEKVESHSSWDGEGEKKGHVSF